MTDILNFNIEAGIKYNQYNYIYFIIGLNLYYDHGVAIIYYI